MCTGALDLKLTKARELESTQCSKDIGFDLYQFLGNCPLDPLHSLEVFHPSQCDISINSTFAIFSYFYFENDFFAEVYMN